MTTHYLEDLSVGQKFDTDRWKVDAARIKSFAAEFDPQPFHLDEGVAEKSLLRGARHERLAVCHLNRASPL
jgi:acyl dehydratase